MHALTTIQQRPPMSPRRTAVRPTRGTGAPGREAAASLSCQRVTPTAPPSWEEMLIAAGLDRESRDLTPGVSRLLDGA